MIPLSTKRFLAAAVAIGAMAHQSLFAHSRGMGTLDINAQGHRLLLTWVFYYDELPAQLVLPPGAANNPEELKQNLAGLSKGAFQLKMEKQTLQAPKISRIIVLPDKTCLIIMTYPVDGDGPLELQAPVLRLLPVNYLINVRFMGADGKVVSSLMDRNSGPLMAFVKAQGIGSSEGSPAGNPFRTAFTDELGAAWVHTNWILLGILLVASNPIKRAGILLAAVIIPRVLLVQIALSLGLGFPWRIPSFLLCLPVILVAALTVRPGRRRFLLAAAAIGSALIYTAYDLQFLPPGENSSLAGSMGCQAGFLAGFLLAMAIVLVIGIELNKSLQFHGEWWRRQICWGTAGISLWISIYNLVAK